MYVVANTVNLSDNVNGDKGSISPTVVSLGEGSPTSIRLLPRIPPLVAPNPTAEDWMVKLDVSTGGTYRMTLLDARGRVWQQRP
jgi:hypothetical protein